MTNKRLIEILEDNEQRLDFRFEYNYLPNCIFLFRDTKDYLIHFDLEDDVLTAEVWIGEEEVQLTEKQIDIIYKFLNTKLEEETKAIEDNYQAYQMDINSRYNDLKFYG